VLADDRFDFLGSGKVELIRHDSAGRLSFDERPFVLTTENGYADLGNVAL
jgi:hypothetical protein